MNPKPKTSIWQAISQFGRDWWAPFLLFSAVLTIVSGALWKTYAEDSVKVICRAECKEEIAATKKVSEKNQKDIAEVKSGMQDLKGDVTDIKALLYQMTTEEQRKRATEMAEYLKEKEK